LSLEGLVLPVLAADETELQAHEAVLNDLDKAMKGISVWRREPVAETAADTADVQAA
jgi:DNA polymerase-3 subunit epsilon